MTADTLIGIGELAERAGLRTSAIRYYEDRGLLSPAARVGGRRRYDASAADRLVVIGFCRELGFSLAEIQLLLEPPGRAAQRRRWVGLVDSKLDQLAAGAARIDAMRDVLRRSRDCDCIDLRECADRCAALLAAS